MKSIHNLITADMSEAVETLSCLAGPSCSTCHQMSLLCSCHPCHISTQGGSPLTRAAHHKVQGIQGLALWILLGLG